MESSSSESLIKDPCLICGAKTKGLHFQVNSCRACAEFYRRSIQIKKSYRCMHGTQKCNLLNWPKDKRLCRFCRFQRCKEIGMCLETDESENTYKMVKNLATKQGIELSQEPKESNLVSFTSFKTNKKFKLDLAPLEEAVAKILSQETATHITPGIRFTIMQRLCYGFSTFYEEMKPQESIRITQEFDLLSLHKHQAKFIIAFAKMLMFCEQFAELDFRDKYVLFKNCWRLAYQLERHYSSIQYFGTDMDDLRLLHDDATAIDYGKIRKAKEMDQETFENSKNLWIPFHTKQQNLLIRPMKTLQLTEYEMVYLMTQILWTVQDDELSEKVQSVAEEVCEQIAGELHNYYAYTIGMSNYANRLVKITKLLESSKVVLNEKKNVFIIARIFDLFECDLTKSELYDWKLL